MKKEMRQVLLLGLMIPVMSACTGHSPDSGKTRTGEERSTGVVSQYRDADKTVWRESWETQTVSGAAVRTDVSANVRVPELDRMSVVEVGRYEYSRENKKRIAEQLFGEEIYYYDTEKLPEFELEKLLETERENVKYKERRLKELEEEEPEERNGQEEEEGDEPYREIVEKECREAKETLKRYEELLKKAPDDFVRLKKDDYGGNAYMGRRDGTEYRLIFEGEEFYLEPLVQGDVVPDQAKDKRGEYSMCFDRQEEGVENECRWQKEEAEELARKFLQDLGFTDLVCEEENALMWNLVRNGELDPEQAFANGWNFTYGVGVDGVSFRSFGVADTTSYPMNCCMSVTVSDKGISGMECFAPVEIQSVTPGVRMLPFSEIKETVRKGMGEYAQYCLDRGKDRIKFNRMELVYYRLPDPEHEDRFSYIPAWRLRDTGNEDLYFVVNAMDGSVIRDWGLAWTLSADWT